MCMIRIRKVHFWFLGFRGFVGSFASTGFQSLIVDSSLVEPEAERPERGPMNRPPPTRPERITHHPVYFYFVFNLRCCRVPSLSSLAAFTLRPRNSADIGHERRQAVQLAGAFGRTSNDPCFGGIRVVAFDIAHWRFKRVTHAPLREQRCCAVYLRAALSRKLHLAAIIRGARYAHRNEKRGALRAGLVHRRLASQGIAKHFLICRLAIAQRMGRGV